MRSTFSCLILGIGLAILYADGQELQDLIPKYKPYEWRHQDYEDSRWHYRQPYRPQEKFQDLIPKYKPYEWRHQDHEDQTSPKEEIGGTFQDHEDQTSPKEEIGGTFQDLHMPINDSDNGNSSNERRDNGSQASSNVSSDYPFEKGYRMVHLPTSNVTICEKMAFHCQQDLGKENVSLICENERKPENGVNCSMMGPVLKLLTSLCANYTPTETYLKDSVDFFKNVFHNHSLWDINTKKTFVTFLPLVIEGISSVALSTALASPERQPRTVVQNSIVIQTNLISPESFANNETFMLEAQGDQMVIHPRGLIATRKITGISLSYLAWFFERNEILLENEMLMNVHVNSRLVSASASSKPRNISIPVNLTFQHLKNKVAQERVLCVHWNSGALSRHGCQQLFSNTTHSECSCQYLSNFALLMATTHKQGDLILSIISYLGLSISVICLFLCIATFLFCRSSHNSSTFIHLQLSLCLFFADLLFIAGIDKTDNKILCSVIAGMLKYLFLACFVWMFLEAVNLYLIVRNLKVANYSGASKYMKISMYLCGYGLPVLIVAISAGINPGAFGTQYYCWLNPDFIWSFMGPVCALIVVNLVLFCLILKNLHEKLASLNSEISSVRNTRSLIFKAIAHVFILGVTWCFGLFQYGLLDEFMAYLFTITSSVQGVFIFLVHCLLNQKVREAYWRWICCIKDIKPPVSEMTVTYISNPLANVPSADAVDNQKVGQGEEP
ncbi:adhesion G protein-coupled receptor E3-like [Python bivittatus]|uniref:Adhesion G protein-coupled receptor E3-like n=1 Tax=Python bivittatus TaxID=176946 RepID=A0A9F5JB01_PYTBI|nr:adhesion G protein-coupled receptor E3-like [Python bivittatus]